MIPHSNTTWAGKNLPIARRPISGSGIDRCIYAEKAATMVRKGASINEICTALNISRKALTSLAQEYDFRMPVHRPGTWPSADEPGEGIVEPDKRYDNWDRARRAAKKLREASTPREVWPQQPAPVFYDHCIPRDVREQLTGALIIDQVCRKHNLSRLALLSHQRRKALCTARHEAAFRMVVELGYSYPRAGRLLGNRDHTTILNSVKRHAAANPEARLAFQAFCRSRAYDDDVMRETAITLHFHDGMSVNTLVKKLSISRIKLMGWLLDEADRRNGTERKRAA